MPKGRRSSDRSRKHDSAQTVNLNARTRQSDYHCIYSPLQEIPSLERSVDSSASQLIVSLSGVVSAGITRPRRPPIKTLSEIASTSPRDTAVPLPATCNQAEGGRVQPSHQWIMCGSHVRCLRAGKFVPDRANRRDFGGVEIPRYQENSYEEPGPRTEIDRRVWIPRKVRCRGHAATCMLMRRCTSSLPTSTWRGRVACAGAFVIMLLQG